MSQIEWDKDELEKKLLQVFAELMKFDKFGADTPMHEIRAQAEMAGILFGRAFAACMHEGPIGADIALEIRAAEQRGKERFLATVERLCKPGGELREHWNGGT